VGHGAFPQGLLSAVEQIAGKQEGVVTVSNQGLGTTELAKKLEEVLIEADNAVYVFIDLAGSSCFNACRALMRKHPEWVFIAGVGLPMLVTYLNYRTRLAGKALIAKTLEAGRRGMERFSHELLTREETE
jgi:mannose/fructose-specific phosphotransferase system component IIA